MFLYHEIAQYIKQENLHRRRTETFTRQGFFFLVRHFKEYGEKNSKSIKIIYVRYIVHVYDTILLGRVNISVGMGMNTADCI